MQNELVQAIENCVKDVMNSTLHTSMPAKIVSFDAETGLADVQPVCSYYTHGIEMAYPVIPQVPICASTNGKAGVCFPISEGDSVMLNVSEQSISTFLNGTSESQQDEPFQLQNCMAVPGLQREASEMQRRANEKDAVVIAHGESIIEVGEDAVTIERGDVLIKISEEGVSVEAKKVAIKGDVELDGNLSVKGDISANGGISATGNVNAPNIGD